MPSFGLPSMYQNQGYHTMPYVDPKLNTPDQVARRRAEYEKNGGNFDTSFVGTNPDPIKFNQTGDLRYWDGKPIGYGDAQAHGGSGYDPYEGMQQGYEPVASAGGDPDVTGGTYQPVDPDFNVDQGASSGGFSMSDLPQWIQDAVGSVGGSLENYAKDPNLLAAIAGAWNSYNQAGKYGDMGKSLREEGNPFGQYRPTYGEGLMELYKDPSSLENSAAYQARMRAGLNTLGPQLAAKGGGFGNMGGEMIKYASDLASTEYDKEWQRRFNAAGGQFGPDASIKAQLDAARLEAEARNAALDQLFTPFGKKDGTTINNNNSGGGSTGGGSNGAPPGVSGSKYSFPPAGQIGATGTWGANGTYKLKDGTVIDVAKLSEAARNGDASAVEWLTKISGGGTVDEQIRNLGVGFEGGDTGDPYNPYVPPIEEPEPYYPPDTSGGNIGDIDVDSWYNSRIGE